MDAHNAADVIVNSVKRSNLNFYIQESPFSLLINLRKTFVKTKTGASPSSDISNCKESTAAIMEKIKVEKLEKENTFLGDTLKDLEAEAKETHNTVHDLSIKLEKAKKETLEALFQLNATTKESEKLKKLVVEKEVENESLELRNKDLQAQINSLKNDKETSCG